MSPLPQGIPTIEPAFIEFYLILCGLCGGAFQKALAALAMYTRGGLYNYNFLSLSALSANLQHR